MPIILINGGPGAPHNYLLPMKVNDEKGDGDGDDDGGGDSGGGGEDDGWMTVMVTITMMRPFSFFKRCSLVRDAR